MIHMFKKLGLILSINVIIFSNLIENRSVSINLNVVNLSMFFEQMTYLEPNILW